MTLSELQPYQFAKLDDAIFMKLPNGDIDAAMPGLPLKSGKIPFDIPVKEATKEEFIKAFNLSNNNGDWYAMLLKDMITKRIPS